MYMLRTARLGEVAVTVWPKQLKDICAKKNIHVLEWGGEQPQIPQTTLI